MTRRAEAERMIARYGEKVTSSGETFFAFLRPAQFRRSGKDSTKETAARWIYTGPATHKLVPGGTVKGADGTEFFVRDCRTVLLGGEELYVRAALVPALSPSGTETVLERGGVRIARAALCEAEGAQDAEQIVPAGESAPCEVAEGAVRWKLTLSGVIPEPGADLASADPFRVTVGRGKGKTVYSGCRWKTMRAAGENVRTLEVLAEARTEEKADG